MSSATSVGLAYTASVDPKESITFSKVPKPFTTSATCHKKKISKNVVAHKINLVIKVWIHVE